MTGSRWFTRITLWTKVALALEGLNKQTKSTNDTSKGLSYFFVLIQNICSKMRLNLIQHFQSKYFLKDGYIRKRSKTIQFFFV